MLSKQKCRLAFGASGMAVALVLAQGAFAQVAPTGSPAAASKLKKKPAEASAVPVSKDAGDTAKGDPAEEIVVVGVRKALESAKAIKQNADTVVDSITANDVGVLPDKSVAEALQRVPGITVSRFSAPNDTQHFSAEPSGVIIRGLDQVRSEFNGRDTFSADTSRGLAWEDITPELLQRVDVYKNQSADLIEGGIAGVIDLHTRVPFDFKGQSIALSSEVNYSKVANSFNPNISGLYSNRWESGIGDFGLLVNGAYSKLDTRSQGIYLGRMGIFAPGIFEGEDRDTYIPTFTTARDNLYSRERYGIAAAAQWRSPSGKLTATAQFNRSSYHQVNTEYSSLNFAFALWGRKADYVIPSAADFTDGAYPLPGQKFTFNEQGSLESGVLTSGLGWWGANEADSAAFGTNSDGIPLVNPSGCGWATSADYTAKYCDAPYDRRGVGEETNSRKITENSMTQDASFNLKWAPTSNFGVLFDAQYVDATKNGYGAAGGLQSYTGMTVDFSGALPKISYTDPLNVNLANGGLSNPNSWNYAWLQDHVERSNGHSLALKADGEWQIGKTWLNSLKFGARYVDRQQINRSAWDFRGITSRWEGAQYYNADKTTPIANVANEGQNTFFAGYPDPAVALVKHSFDSNFLGGGVMDTSPLLYINPNLLGNLSRLNQYFSHQTLGIGDYYPICSAAGPTRGSEIIGADGKSTCFTPGETLDVSEKVKAAYVMLRFGGKDAHVFSDNIGISGNIGVRYVETHSVSHGSADYGTFNFDQTDCFKFTTPTTVDPNNPYIPPSTPYSAGCYIVGAAKHNATVDSLPDTIDDGTGTGHMIPNPRKFILPNAIVGSPDDLAFHNGAIQPVVGDKLYRNWLPSFNLKLNFGTKTIMRFAFSRAMSRPDLSMFRYAAYIGNPGADVSYTAQCKTFNTTTQTVVPVANCTPNPELTFDSSGALIAARPRYTVGTGNPYIKPVTADNIDVTFEHYWKGIGQFSVNLFYKKFYDYITYGTTIVPVTNNGVTRDLYINGPVNGDGASVKGAEIAFQTFFDFLPGPFKYFGVQGNYTRILNTGIQNTNYDTGSGGDASTSDYYVKTDHLQGLSDSSYNAVVFFEKGRVGLRAAYNWRSKYLVTAHDCCNLPVWQDSQGYLDASLRYRLNDKIEMSVQASNLLDTTTHLLQQVTGSDDPKDPNHLVPTAWFKSDQRVSFSIRGKF